MPQNFAKLRKTPQNAAKREASPQPGPVHHFSPSAAKAVETQDISGPGPGVSLFLLGGVASNAITIAHCRAMAAFALASTRAHAQRPPQVSVVLSETLRSRFTVAKAQWASGLEQARAGGQPGPELVLCAGHIHNEGAKKNEHMGQAGEGLRIVNLCSKSLKRLSGEMRLGATKSPG